MATISAAGKSYGEYDAANRINNVSNAWHRFVATRSPQPPRSKYKTFATAYRAAIKRYARPNPRASLSSRFVTAKVRRHKNGRIEIRLPNPRPKPRRKARTNRRSR